MPVSTRAVNRSDGKGFEAHVYKWLLGATRSDPKTVLRWTKLALAGYRLYRWADAPARELRRIGWHSCHEEERRQLYADGNPDRRGFAEYGGDWLAIKEYSEYAPSEQALLDDPNQKGRFHAIIGQDKDWRVLSLKQLGTFFAVGEYVRNFNRAQGWKHGEKVSMVLCCPDRDDSRITRPAQQHIEKLRPLWEFECVRVPGFEREEGERSEEADAVSTDEEVVDFVDTLTMSEATPAPPPAAASSSSARPSARAQGERKRNSMVDFEAETRPEGAKERPYQRRWAQNLRNDSGVHLLQGPPGIGKTHILGLVMGDLVVRQLPNKQAPKGIIACFVAPFVDHCVQFEEKTEVHLRKQLGDRWRDQVVSIYQRPPKSKRKIKSCKKKGIPSKSEVKQRLDNGAKVFVATEKSCDILLELAMYAIKEGYKLLIMKDEAHYCCRNHGKSMELMRLAKLPNERTTRSAGIDPVHRGIICTATPTQAIKDMCDHQKCIMTLQEAFYRYRVIRPYKVVIPLITRRAALKKDGLPSDMHAMIAEDGLPLGQERLPAATLFTVHQMLEDGARRCIVYVRNGKQARKVEGYLERACASYSAECESRVILQSTKDRWDKYQAFATNATSRNDGEQKQVIVLQFLVAVSILDFGIDIPACDSISVLTPPIAANKGNAVESAHRLIQRIGRTLRGEHGEALVMVFASPKNTWLANVSKVLNDFDPDCEERISVSSYNPVKKGSKKTKELEDAALEEVKEKYDFSGQRALDKKRKREEEQEAKAKKVRHVAPAGKIKYPGHQEHGFMFKDKERTVRPEVGESWYDTWTIPDKKIKWRVCGMGQKCRGSDNFIKVTNVTSGSGQKYCGQCAMYGTCPAIPIAKADRSASTCSASGATSINNGHHEKDGAVVRSWVGRCCNNRCASAIAMVLYEHDELGVAYPPGFEPPKESVARKRKRGVAVAAAAAAARAESPSSSSGVT